MYIYTLKYFLFSHAASDYNPPPPPLRLVGGETENEGRIDIYIGNQWGTICSADWGLADAEVACKSLGYTSAQTYDLGHNAPFNGGSMSA